MKAALRAKLLSLAAVTALVGQRVAWVRRQQSWPQPSIVLHLIDGAPDVYHGGPSGLRESRVQVDCWGLSLESTNAIARAVEAGLTAQSFTQSGVRFDVILLIDERDSTFDEPPETLFRTSLDLMVRTASA